MDDALTKLLEMAARPGEPRTYEDAASWWADHRARTSGFDAPIDRAIASALSVDRVAWAFAGGYLRVARRDGRGRRPSARHPHELRWQDAARAQTVGDDPG